MTFAQLSKRIPRWVGKARHTIEVIILPAINFIHARRNIIHL
jgi:hypothetical protein